MFDGPGQTTYHDLLFASFVLYLLTLFNVLSCRVQFQDLPTETSKQQEFHQNLNSVLDWFVKVQSRDVYIVFSTRSRTQESIHFSIRLCQSRQHIG